MSRKLLARVVDLHDQPVGPASGTVLQASAFDTLQDVYGRAGVDDRAVVSCTTLAHAAVPLSHSTRWPDLNASLDSLDEDCLSLGLPKFGVVVFTVGLKQRTACEESVTATDGQQQSGGLVAVLAGGRRACLRTHFISTALVAVWLKPHLPKGRLAQDVCLHLAEQGAGFLSSEGETCQKKLFLGLTDVCRVQTLAVAWHRAAPKRRVLVHTPATRMRLGRPSERARAATS